MAEYRRHLIQAARPAPRRGMHKTSSIQVLEKTEQGNLLRKQFRYEVDDDDSLRRAIERARRYVDNVADRDLLMTPQR